MGRIEVDGDFVMADSVSNWTTCLKELVSAMTNVVGYGLFGSDLVLRKLGVLVFVVLPWLLGELSGDNGFLVLFLCMWCLVEMTDSLAAWCLWYSPCAFLVYHWINLL
ncbi:hypothetical protein Droror1_Dr00014877 [Drosera rotundifolia]